MLFTSILFYFLYISYSTLTVLPAQLLFPQKILDVSSNKQNEKEFCCSIVRSFRMLSFLDISDTET